MIIVHTFTNKILRADVSKAEFSTGLYLSPENVQIWVNLRNAICIRIFLLTKQKHPKPAV